MNFFDNLLEEFGLTLPTISPNFRVVLIGDNLAYFENIRSIKSFSPSKISLLIKNGEIVVEGEGMFFKKYDLGDLVICGKITALKRV